MSQITYIGRWAKYGSPSYEAIVERKDETGATEPLLLRHDLVDHASNWNSSGYLWGYGGSWGSGPCQMALALALCADVLGDDERACEVYRDFMWAFVSELPPNGWTRSREDILTAIEQVEGIRRGA